jgi:predicted metal-dependent peptidase
MFVLLQKPPDEALSYALLKFSRRQPFYSTLAFFLNPVLSDDCRTAATDGLGIWINPDFFTELTLEQQVGLLWHEVLHIAFEHAFRRGERDRRLWNIACDFVANQMIVDAGGDIPPGGCLDNRFKDLIEEEVYARLLPDMEDIKKRYSKFADLLDVEPLSSQEGERLRQRARSALLKAAHAGRLIGELPAGVARYLARILKPEQDWRALLAEYLTTTKKSDYDWMTPNRRNAAFDFFLPGYRQAGTLEHVAVVIDTSGSIGEDELPRFIGEILGIVGLCSPNTLTVVPCDAKVYAPIQFDATPEADEVMAALSVKGVLKGGGGTDMPAALDWIEQAAGRYELNPPPAVVLVMTDGFTPFGKEGDYPVIWCIAGDAGKVAPPPWGRVVWMGEPSHADD